MQTRSLTRMLAASIFAAGFVAVAQPEPPRPDATPATRQPAAQPRGADPARGPEGRAPGRGEPRGGGNDNPTSVEGCMKGINRSIKRIKLNLDKPDTREENLRLVGDAERFAVMAKGMTPRKVPDDKKAEMEKSYRKDLIAAIRMMLDLETDIADNKTDAVKEDLKKITEKSLEAHKALGIKEED